MHAILYLIVAVAAGLVGVRAVQREATRSTSLDFALMCLVLGVTYLGFAFYLVAFPVWPWARVPFAVAGAMLPAAHLRFLDHFFAADEGERGGPKLEVALWGGGLLLSIAYVVTTAFSELQPNPGLPEKVLGVLVFGGFGLSVWRLWEKHEAAASRVERIRITYLLLFMSGAVLFSGLEGAGRMVYPAAIDALHDLRNPLLRSVDLQGPLPPVGALFTGLYLYFLDRVRSAQRLLDLHEVGTQLIAVGALAACLSGVVSLAALSVYVQFKQLPSATYLVFVCAIIFLLFYPQLLQTALARVTPLLNPKGAQLAEALSQVDRDLSSVITVDQLSRAVLDRLHNSGRLRSAALYLQQPERQQYRLVGHRTVGGLVTLPVVAPHPFIDGFEAGASAYGRAELQRWSQAEDAAARLRILEGMNADLVVPVRSGDLILGWLALEEDALNSDGFSNEEIARLGQLTARMAVVLENIKGFEAGKEQARLAALGTMAAGLAHEIRNPLAGIKGAAQVIGRLPEEQQQEFLQVISDEVDRLNIVVTSFLDYARHFDLRREVTDLNSLLTQVLSLVRAQQDLPPGVAFIEALDPELPFAAVDGDKLRQVVLNLLQNAVQALPEGGGQVTVRSRVGGHDGPSGRRPAAVIEVQDTGEGIPADLRASLFVPFYTTKPFGTGLGLAISERIVAAHEGELRVLSQVGVGSTFAVVLPLPDPVTAASLDEELRAVAD